MMDIKTSRHQDIKTSSLEDLKTRSLQEDEDFQVGVYVTLEALIGEFDCATLIGYMETVPVPAEPFKSGFQPLDDLPKFVEWFKAKRDAE